MSGGQSSRPKSAFQAVYIITFGVAIYKMLSFIASDKTPLTNKLLALSATNPELEEFLNWMTWLPAIFAGLLALHLIRIYITLEILEDGESLFEGFYQAWPKWLRIAETIVRVGIVYIVASKLTLPRDYVQMWDYSVWFYASLSIWSFLAIIADGFREKSSESKNWWKRLVAKNGRTFAFSSFAGLSASLVLSQFSGAASMWTVLFLAIAILALGFDLIAFALGKRDVSISEEPKQGLRAIVMWHVRQRVIWIIIMWYAHQYFHNWDYQSPTTATPILTGTIEQL